MASLRELIEQAEADIDRYKNPDIHEFTRRIDEILTAGKLGAIASDNVESISFYEGQLCISTSYYVRGCSMSGEYKIPETVIDSDDPIAAIKVWAKEQRVAKAQHDYDACERQLGWYRERLVKAKQEEL